MSMSAIFGGITFGAALLYKKKKHWIAVEALYDYSTLWIWASYVAQMIQFFHF